MTLECPQCGRDTTMLRAGRRVIGREHIVVPCIFVLVPIALVLARAVTRGELEMRIIAPLAVLATLASGLLLMADRHPPEQAPAACDACGYAPSSPSAATGRASGEMGVSTRPSLATWLVAMAAVGVFLFMLSSRLRPAMEPTTAAFAPSGGSNPPAPATQPPPPPAVTADPSRPTAVPSPTAAAWVTVGNTDGEGVYLRRTPNPDDRLTAWPDGTRLQIVGPDRDTDDRRWKNVRDPDGQTGWVPAEYVIPSAPP